ncbi:hypothetical protein E4K72_08215 [Oxalobacteraceae bacterium OM1]|nr:hypothetical protein E4K72_08215 [Oxalobacteraceae bacterium OM1]
MDYGEHVYYIACPNAGCGGIYHVRQGFDGYPERGQLICPYCDWTLRRRPRQLSTIRTVLSPEEQAEIRARTTTTVGRIEIWSDKQSGFS